MSAVVMFVLLGAASSDAQVTFDRLLKAPQEPQNWLTYSGNLNGQRHSPLTSITPANVKNLQLEWVLQSRAPSEVGSKYESTSLVVDGVMYTVQPPNVIIAVDAATKAALANASLTVGLDAESYGRDGNLHDYVAPVTIQPPGHA